MELPVFLNIWTLIEFFTYSRPHLKGDIEISCTLFSKKQEKTQEQLSYKHHLLVVYRHCPCAAMFQS